MLTLTHTLRSFAGPPAADRSLSFYRLAFCPEVDEATQNE
jgi:hypothetical protein